MNLNLIVWHERRRIEGESRKVRREWRRCLLRSPLTTRQMYQFVYISYTRLYNITVVAITEVVIHVASGRKGVIFICNSLLLFYIDGYFCNASIAMISLAYCGSSLELYCLSLTWSIKGLVPFRIQFLPSHILWNAKPERRKCFIWNPSFK